MQGIMLPNLNLNWSSYSRFDDHGVKTITARGKGTLVSRDENDKLLETITKRKSDGLLLGRCPP